MGGVGMAERACPFVFAALAKLVGPAVVFEAVVVAAEWRVVARACCTAF